MGWLVRHSGFAFIVGLAAGAGIIWVVAGGAPGRDILAPMTAVIAAAVTSAFHTWRDAYTARVEGDRLRTQRAIDLRGKLAELYAQFFGDVAAVTATALTFGPDGLTPDFVKSHVLPKMDASGRDMNLLLLMEDDAEARAKLGGTMTTIGNLLARTLTHQSSAAIFNDLAKFNAELADLQNWLVEKRFKRL
jgi:hypothetical protein